MHRRLDDHICFTLYATSMAITRTYKPMLDAMGITYPQYLMLSALAEQNDITIGAIARRLGLESSTVTPPVKRLEQAGFVQRKRSTTDERQVTVHMTGAGRALLTKCKCLGDALIENSGMTEAQLTTLNRQIQKFHKALCDKLDAAATAR
ncbi:MAG: MarR family transcriptional regulator [Pseudolabrys sp.]